MCFVQWSPICGLNSHNEIVAPKPSHTSGPDFACYLGSSENPKDLNRRRRSGCLRDIPTNTHWKRGTRPSDLFLSRSFMMAPIRQPTPVSVELRGVAMKTFEQRGPMSGPGAGARTKMAPGRQWKLSSMRSSVRRVQGASRRLATGGRGHKSV